MGASGFSNEAVAADALPAIERLQWQGLSPKYHRLNQLMTVAETLIFVLADAALLLQPLVPLSPFVHALALWALPGMVALGLAGLCYNHLADPLKQYALRQRDLSYRQGLIFRRIITQPILRIQHTELQRGPVERWAGLATLQLFSAGGESETFAIPGLALERAEQLRQFILDNRDSAQRG